MDIKEIEEWQKGVIQPDTITYTIKIEEHWKACKYVGLLLDHIKELEDELAKIKSDPSKKVWTKKKKKDYLDFETDCSFPSCRAKTHQVNHSFCKKHQKYFDMMAKKNLNPGKASLNFHNTV